MACCAFIAGIIGLFLALKAKLLGPPNTNTDRALEWRLEKMEQDE
jgi:hypothetical protein